jgi:hypothetical protein
MLLSADVHLRVREAGVRVHMEGSERVMIALLSSALIAACRNAWYTAGGTPEY